jgi:threonine synthase
LSTAHPCKFPDVLPDHVSKAIVIPGEVKNLDGKTKHAGSLGTDFEGFKKYLLKHG